MSVWPTPRIHKPPCNSQLTKEYILTSSTGMPAVENDEWTKAGLDAKDAMSSAGDMLCHAATATGDMAKKASSDVCQSADDLTARAGSNIEQFGQMMSENAPHDGVLGRAAQSVAHTVQQSGQYIEDNKLSGMTEAVTDLVRRNPMTSLAIGVGIGFLLSRALRN
jgi:ElaB/YqjD/DUF883 family membrane-anchored ribosome-binding protein